MEFSGPWALEESMIYHTVSPQLALPHSQPYPTALGDCCPGLPGRSQVQCEWLLIRTMGCIYRKGRAPARGPLQPWTRRSLWLLLSQDYYSTVLMCPLQFSTPWGVAISLSASAGYLSAFCCCQVCRPLELFDFIFCPSESWWLSWSPCVLFVWGIISSGCEMYNVKPSLRRKWGLPTNHPASECIVTTAMCHWFPFAAR